MGEDIDVAECEAVGAMKLPEGTASVAWTPFGRGIVTAQGRGLEEVTLWSLHDVDDTRTGSTVRLMPEARVSLRALLTQARVASKCAAPAYSYLYYP